MNSLSRSALALILFVGIGVTPPVLARDGDAVSVTLDARLFSGLPHRIAYQAPYVYAAMDTGIEVFDVSMVTAPAPVGRLYLPSPAFDLVVAGTLIYVANGESGLAIVDVANPALPILVGRLAMPLGSGAEARGIAVSGALAVVAEAAVPGSMDYGVRVVNVASATTPVLIGRLALDNGALTVAIAGTHAFVGVGTDLARRQGLVTVDVSTPSTPFEVIASFLPTGLAVNRVAVEGTVAYLAVGDRSTGALLSVSIAVPTLPTVLDDVALPNGVMDVRLLPGVAYVALRENGIRRFATGTPSSLLPLGAIVLGQSAIAVAPRGDVAFVGLRSSNGGGALAVVATPSPGTMSLTGTWSCAEATAVAASPGLGYLLRRDALHVFDTTSPTAPFEIGAWRPLGGDFSAMAVASGIAAIAEGRTVHLVSVAIPSSPTPLGSLTVSSGYVTSLALSANVLYAVTGVGLETFDVMAPSSPMPLATLPTTSWSADIAIDGRYAYLVAGSELLVLDFAVPASPSTVATLSIPGAELIGVDGKGAIAVLTGRTALLYTVDLPTPASPSLAATFGVGRRGNAITLIGDRAVVAAGREGMRVLDVSDITAPREEAWYDTSGEAVSLANDGQILFLAGTESQHWIAQCETCTVACLERWPDIAQNSLRAVKKPTRDVFTWDFVSAGSGESNLHTTNLKTALPDLWMDMVARVQRTSSRSVVEPFLPPVGQPQFYRVFGAGECLDLSYWP